MSRFEAVLCLALGLPLAAAASAQEAPLRPSPGAIVSIRASEPSASPAPEADLLHLSWLRQVLRPDRAAAGTGLGWVATDAGLVVTSAELVTGAGPVEVTLSDGRQLSARPVEVDHAAGYALLELPGAGPAPLPLGASAGLSPGASVSLPTGLDGTRARGCFAGRLPSASGAGWLLTWLPAGVELRPGTPLLDAEGRVIGANARCLRLGLPWRFPALGLAVATPLEALRPGLEQGPLHLDLFGWQVPWLGPWGGCQGDVAR